jgi:hypothetical protein
VRSWGLPRKWDNAGKQIRLERFEVLSTCMGGVSTADNGGEEHDQRERVYGGRNSVSIKTLQKYYVNR